MQPPPRKSVFYWAYISLQLPVCTFIWAYKPGPGFVLFVWIKRSHGPDSHLHLGLRLTSWLACLLHWPTQVIYINHWFFFLFFFKENNIYKLSIRKFLVYNMKDNKFMESNTNNKYAPLHFLLLTIIWWYACIDVCCVKTIFRCYYSVGVFNKFKYELFKYHLQTLSQ